MQRKLCDKLLKSNRKVSLMLDEATLFGSAVVVLYLRGCLAAEFDCLPAGYGVENVLFSLVEATEGTTAAGIMSAITSKLSALSIKIDEKDKDWLSSALIAVCTDGASVMTGMNSGVATLLAQKYGQHIEHFHCMAHRLELCVGDALKAVTATNQLQIFVSSLFSLYSMSPKNQRELRLAAAETETELLRIKGIFTVRWVASSFRAARAVWRNFPPLCKHFATAATDTSRVSTERSKFDGLRNKLATVTFVKDLALLKDVLREISSLSLQLQKRDISVVDAMSATDMTVKILHALKNHDGKSQQKANVFLNQDIPEFKGVVLKPGKGGINKQQFVQAIVDSMKQRFTEQSRDLVKDLAVLDSKQWPDDDSRLLFGDATVVRLCKKFNLPAKAVVQQFRNVKDGNQGGKEYNQLMAIRQTYPASSAECERGFSLMNNIATNQRNCLKVETLSNLMFVNVNGPDIDDFDPLPFVRSWLAAGGRQSISHKPGAASKTEKRKKLVQNWVV
jgi:hypothetical protein